MWIFGVSLMTLWMTLVLLGLTAFGLTHLLLVAAVALELRRTDAPRRKRIAFA